MDGKWRVLLLDTKEGNPNHYVVVALEHALRNHKAVEMVRCPDYADALPIAIRERCNLLFAFDGEGIDRGLCRRLAAVCGTSLLWVTEDPYERQVNTSNAELFDFIFTNDSASVHHYKGRARHLPLAASRRFNYHEVPDHDDNHYLYDVLFIGTAWPNRVRLLKKLLAKLEGLKLKIALPGNEHLPVADLGLPPSAYLWRVPNSEMARLANRSRVVLTLHRDFSGSGDESAAATPGPRLFEVALAGGFQLVDLSLPEAGVYFRVGHEIAGFQSPDECCEQIRFFIDDSRVRLAMARAAQERCLAEHLYEHRVDHIFGKIAPHPGPPPQARREYASSGRRGRDGRTRLLYVSHNTMNVRPFGGVEVYVDQLVRHLPDCYEPLLYYPDRRYPLGQVMVLEKVRTRQKIRKVLRGPTDENALQDLEREVHFADLLHDQQIDLVHFQHLIGHPWSLPLVARTLGLPTVMTFSDHFAVCAHFNLMNAGRQYCNIPALPRTTCDLCLNEQDRALSGSQAARRSFIAGVMANLDLMIFLSESTRAIAQAIYAAASDENRVWVEGLPIAPACGSRSRTRHDRPLKVVVLGNFDHIKGGDALCKTFDALRKDDVEFHVHGHIRPPYDQILRALALPKVHLHGAYSRDALHSHLLDADLGLFLSVWPETYLLTLSEAWRAGVVPIVTDIGAPGERVAHRVNGLKVPVNEPGSVVHLLRELNVERDEIDRMRLEIHSGLYRLIDDHIRLLTDHYEDLLLAYRIRDRAREFFDERPARRAAAAGNVFRMEPIWLKQRPGAPAIIAGDAEIKPVWKKVVPYFRRHGFRATARRSAEKIFGRMTLQQIK